MDRFKCLDVTIACLFNIVLSIAIVVSIKLSFFKIKINYIMLTQEIITNFVPLGLLSFCMSLDLIDLLSILFISVVALSLTLILFSIPNGFMRILRNGQWILVPILTGTAAGASNAVITNVLGGGNNPTGGNTGGNNHGGNNPGGNTGGNNQGGNNPGGNTGGNNQGGNTGGNNQSGGGSNGGTNSSAT